MKTLTKCLIVLALAGTTVAAIASNAMASRALRLLPGGALSVSASGLLTMNVSGITIICTVDVTSSINGSIDKIAGGSAGSVTGFNLSRCNDGATGSLDSASTLYYGSFSGVLPSPITGINTVANPVLFTLRGGVWFANCQYRSQISIVFHSTSNSITSSSLNGTASPLTSGCPSFTMSGSGLPLVGRSVSFVLA